MKQKLSFFILIFFASLTQSNYGMLDNPKKRTFRHSTSERTRALVRSISGEKNTSSPNKPLRKSKSAESCSINQKPLDIRLASISEENDLNSLISIDPEKINDIFSHGETLFVWAAHNNKTSLISSLMIHDNLLINQKNNYNQTAFHYSAYHKNEDAIKYFLSDPRTDASITNNKNKTARDMIEGNAEKDINLRRVIFARTMLDLTVNKKCFDIQDIYFKAWLATSNAGPHQIPILEFFIANIFERGIVEIKKALQQDHNKQKEEDRILPDSAKMPNYADDNFIAKMLLYRLIKKPNGLENFSTI